MKSFIVLCDGDRYLHTVQAARLSDAVKKVCARWAEMPIRQYRAKEGLITWTLYVGRRRQRDDLLSEVRARPA